MLISDKTLTSKMINSNFITLNLLFNSIYRKKEVVQLIKVFSVYDSEKNKKDQDNNFLSLINKWFNVQTEEFQIYEETEKYMLTESDIIRLVSMDFGVPTMYVFFLHLLRSKTIDSFYEAYKMYKDVDSVKLSEDLIQLINDLYKEDETIFDTMKRFFFNYYIEEVILNKDFEFVVYRKYFLETVKAIADNTTDKSQCEDILRILSITKSSAQKKYLENYNSLFANILDQSIIYVEQKIDNFIDVGKVAKSLIQEQIKNAKLKIQLAMEKQSIDANYVKFNNTLKAILEENAEQSKNAFVQRKEVLLTNLSQIENYTQKIIKTNALDNSKFFTNFDNFFENFFKCVQTGQEQYLENMELLLDEEIETLNVPYTFYYKTVWYLIAILGTKFGTTNLEKSQNFIHQIKTFNWEKEIKNKSGEEIFKDKFWKYFAAYANYMNEGYSEYNVVLKDKGFQNMQKAAIEASKILSQSNDKELENVKKEIHKIFYEKIDYGFGTLHGGIYGTTQNIADLLYELSVPIELTFNKNVVSSFFEEIKNAATMCIKGAAIEAIYFLCFNKFDFLGDASLFDLINKLRYYNEIMKSAATLKLENNQEKKKEIIMQSEEYIQKVKNGFSVFNQNPNVKNNCFWFVYQYIYRRNTLLGYEFNSTNSDWWRTQISTLKDKESAFIYLSYISYNCKNTFDPKTFLQSFNSFSKTQIELDDASKKTYDNINAFFGIKGYREDEFKKLGIDFINQGVMRAIFGTEQLNNFYAVQINKLNRENIMPLSFKSFSNKSESEFSLFFMEIQTIETNFINEKLTSFNDDVSVFLMRFAPTMQLLLKNIPSFSSIINLDGIINKFEETINYLLLFVNDSINKLTNDLTENEEKYILEMSNKKYYYMAQAIPVAIDYIYKLITSKNFSFAALIKQVEKSTIDFEDLEELENIYNDFEEHITQLQNKDTKYNGIKVNPVSSINKKEFVAVKNLIEQLKKYNSVYAENNKIYFTLDKRDVKIETDYIPGNTILIEVIKEYIEITDKEIELITNQERVLKFIDYYLNNNVSINKSISSYEVTNINIEDLQKSIKDNFVKKQLQGSKNIIELSNEAKQEKINLRFDLYK